MLLRDYIQANPGSGVRLAAGLGISASYLSQMTTGHRPVSPETCVQMEQITDGAVRRWDLRPDDWHRIWPELIGADGAPTVPVETREVA